MLQCKTCNNLRICPYEAFRTKTRLILRMMRPSCIKERQSHTSLTTLAGCVLVGGRLVWILPFFNASLFIRYELHCVAASVMDLMKLGGPTRYNQIPETSWVWLMGWRLSVLATRLAFPWSHVTPNWYAKRCLRRCMMHGLAISDNDFAKMLRRGWL